MSPEMRALVWWARLTVRPILRSPAATRLLLRTARRAPTAPPRSLLSRHRVRAETTPSGFPLWTVTPRENASGPASAPTVFYLHGGGYIFSIGPVHWRFVRHLADAGHRVVVPTYGLAPAHDHRAALPHLTGVYARTVTEARRDGRGLAVLGDSAGGGLALALVQNLPADLPRPERLVLLSPWLDVTMSHPEVRAAERAEAMLGRPGLLIAARAWAGDVDLSDPRVSPIEGPILNLPPVEIHVSGAELLLSDARRLRDRLAEAGRPVRLWIEPDAIHDHPLTATPEGARARETITTALRRGADAPGTDA
ncbi:alpha/beta hydrolase fold domain-containing protein (plasmid) [Streptomyces sp. BI20]|uniref:alpha/beta hydrolase fold domain-containing protein n=1 Tax=Streptomyces sp. BI20 TaxID=3403460 RepID=UPI003C78D855